MVAETVIPVILVCGLSSFSFFSVLVATLVAATFAARTLTPVAATKKSYPLKL